MSNKLDEFIASLPKKTVDTKYGPVTGYIAGGAVNFKGIPYAAPPIGGLRWKPPEPPVPWKDSLVSTKFGCICPQDTTFFPAFGPMDEDCLSLNIWTPEDTQRGPYPVMVWLHGGGFTTGSGSMPIYDGTYFASLGMVVVSINYRLNVLGFLAHPELTAESLSHSSGNYGIMDQIFALKWVKDNISRFGGDPGNVTIFGESAGGASVAALLSSPLAAGLFHRAIAQSSGNTPSLLRKLGESNGHLESAESLGLRFVRKLGFEGEKGILKKMRALPAKELVEAWYKSIQEDVTGTGFTGSWQINHLVIDGHVLKDSPAETFLKGMQNNVPFITGTTADEGTVFRLFLFRGPDDLDRYKRFAGRAFGAAKDKVLEQYLVSDADSAGQAACNVLGSGFFCGARRLARSMSAIQPRTYRYLFSMPPKFFLYQIPGIADWKERFGCFHAAEIPFVFHFMALPGFQDEDRALADQIAGCWARFARTGDPNGDGAPNWPRYTQKEENYLVLDNPVKAGNGYKNKECDFVEELETARL
jgi:para-nitrobenzyl esterase